MRESLPLIPALYAVILLCWAMADFRVTYIHDRARWPDLTWDAAALAVPLSDIHYARGDLMGQLSLLGFDTRSSAMLETIVQDVTRSSRIEGEYLDVEQVRSSVARRLGLPDGGLPAPARTVEGVVAMTLDATQRYDQPLTAERLYGWHRQLFASGYDDRGHDLQVGRWRDTEMQVLGPNMTKTVVHFEAPAPDRVPQEMTSFLGWVEDDQGLDPVIKAGLAHLRFLTVHPFEDGNGRIARALTDLLLARADRQTQRYYSLSRQIETRRSEYYRVLESTQRSATTDVTDWLAFYLSTLSAALGEARTALALAQARHLYFARFAHVPLEERTRKVLGRLFEPFEGKFSNKKYRAMTGVSDDTVNRDLNHLVDAGLLRREGRTKGTYYLLDLSAALPTVPAALKKHDGVLYWFGDPSADAPAAPETP